MSGYIGNIPVPAATQTRDTFTATAGQTSFATSGYTPSFLDVFLNGVHLVNGTDYTATNGSDVVLTSGAADGDVLEVVAYSTYQVNSQNYTGGLTVDNDGATVLTVDRATSDGTIIDLQKDGSTVGSIGTKSSDLYIGKAESGLLFDVTGADGIRPFNTTAIGESDGNLDLGSSSSRFKNLYLSGGVYLGGTGSANYLDDYESGSWTPTYVPQTNSFSSITYDASVTGRYVKVGDIVHAAGFVSTDVLSVGSATGSLWIGGLPFAVANSPSDVPLWSGSIGFVDNFAGDTPISAIALRNTTNVGLYYRTSVNGGSITLNVSDMSTAGNSNSVYFTVSYRTTA